MTEVYIFKFKHFPRWKIFHSFKT